MMMGKWCSGTASVCLDIELKREVNEMARKVGIAPFYDLALMEAGT